jgi:hypothetical protein
VVRDDPRGLVLDLQSRWAVPLVVRFRVPDSKCRVVILAPVVSLESTPRPAFSVFSVSIPASVPAPVLTSVSEIAESLSTMFPIVPAFLSLCLARSTALAESSAIFLSITAFFVNSSEASPLAFLIVPISFCRMLSSRRADSCSKLATTSAGTS